LSRDTQSVSERLIGDTYTAAVQLSAGPALLTFHLGSRSIRIEVTPQWQRHPASGRSDDRLVADATVSAHGVVTQLLGLDDDPGAFARLARKVGHAKLVHGRTGLRISRTQSIFDGLIWSIIGQQINFPFACLLKRRVTELAGIPVADGLIAPPTPEAIAALDPADLLPLQFSRQKADYLVALSRLVARGELDLESLRAMSATRAERTLLALRGLGPWSVNYVMMRALGFADCVPLGDTGVTSGLQALFDLSTRPNVDDTRRLMAIFSPYRSLATAHLWQLLQPPPK
jgi:AraC family transcriptional regulator of adaptative response / DNA-3-methyladenine glycosylase II